MKYRKHKSQQKEFEQVQSNEGTPSTITKKLQRKTN